MAASDDVGSLARAFSGLGVDEQALISILGKWHSEQRQHFRKGTRDFFTEDERQFERWNDRHILQLRHEFLRLKDAIVMWTMHPWERDARLLKEALYKGPQYNVLVEIACTRSSEELLGARRAYHSLFDHSIEEDIAFHVHAPEKELLVAILSSYRYEGPKVNEETAKLEAKTLSDVIGKKGLDKKDENVLDASLGYNVDEISKEALSRVIVTRADADMKQIKEEYHGKYGVSLGKKIEEVANGNYRDFLLTLIARSGE
ncbi:UNVERIFIED_CONTAM: Annexin D4 [Sesamum angustifolium]|uniref:Annexin D4 n=1 Tax=Sesamum angustifolium TaxID=2727405 RepID=A0AAW2RII1_9LAMI